MDQAKPAPTIFVDSSKRLSRSIKANMEEIEVKTCRFAKRDVVTPIVATAMAALLGGIPPGFAELTDITQTQPSVPATGMRIPRDPRFT